MEGLKDIKDIVEVHEHSFETFMGIVLFSLLVVILLLYLFLNRRKRRKKLSVKALAKEALSTLDYNNPKEVVYGFIKNIEPFLNEKNQEEFKSIERELIPYKYKKEIPDLDENLKNRILTFIKGVR